MNLLEATKDPGVAAAECVIFISLAAVLSDPVAAFGVAPLFAGNSK